MTVSQDGGVSIRAEAGTAVVHGTSLVDFGDTPSPETTVAVSGQIGITPTSHVRVSVQGDSMSFNNENDHLLFSRSVKLAAGIPVADVGFTIYAESDLALWTKRFRVRWSWWN